MSEFLHFGHHGSTESSPACASLSRSFLELQMLVEEQGQGLHNPCCGLGSTSTPHPQAGGEQSAPGVLQAGDRAVPSEGRPRGGPPPEGQRSQPEPQTPWWEPDSLLRNHLGYSNYILYGQITLTVKWQLLSNLKIYILSYSSFQPGCRAEF